MLTTRDPRPARPWCLFRSAGRAFAISLDSVIEIVEADGLIRLPLSPPCVRGYCIFRRDVVPVVRLADGTRGEQTDSLDRIVILILRTEQSAWGIGIDRGGVVVTEEVLEESSAYPHDGSGPVLIGSLHRDGMIHGVIDPALTWRRLRDSVERWYGSQHARALPRRTEPALSHPGATV